MPEPSHRFLEHPDGRAVRVTIVPRETSTGLHPELRTLVFEAVGGGCIGSASILATYPLWSLTGEELQGYFGRASFPRR